MNPGINLQYYGTYQFSLSLKMHTPNQSFNDEAGREKEPCSDAAVDGWQVRLLVMGGHFNGLHSGHFGPGGKSMEVSGRNQSQL